MSEIKLFPVTNLGMSGQKVAVVGAGLAGSVAAMNLAERGVFVDLFEARPDRVGGRTWSSWFKNRYHGGPEYDDQKFEIGGEAIDGGHIQTKQLVQKLGLTLVNMYQAEPKGAGVLYWVSKAGSLLEKYPEDQVKDDAKAVWQIIKGDVNKAGFPTLYDDYTETGAILSNTKLSLYIDDICRKSGLTDGRLAQILKMGFTTEFGLEPTIQSVLNMLYLMAYHGQGQVRFFGQNSEKFTVAEGNQQMSIRAVQKYTQLSGKNVNMGYKLVKLERLADGKLSLRFLVWQDDNAPETVETKIYDRVIMCVPVYTMRPDTMNPGALLSGNTEDGSDVNFDWHIDVSKAQLSFKKRQAIIGLNPAECSKLMVQFEKRFWYDEPNNCNGDIFATRVVNGTETMFQNTWETTRGQVGVKGILTNFTGGDYSANNCHTTGVDSPLVMQTQVNDFVTKLELVCPGALANVKRDAQGNITSNFYGKRWTQDQYARGAYTSYSNGDEAPPPNGTEPSTSFVGAEPRAEPADEPDVKKRNIHFAGEYTDFEGLGFMDGAVSSGNRVSLEVLDALK